MIAKKITDIIGDFINKVQSHPAAMKKAQRIDDLEAVLRTLFASDDEQAIEMSDKIRHVLERKHVTMEKRISMVEKILCNGGIHL
jgi:CTP-dependent riboflavin kinase